MATEFIEDHQLKPSAAHAIKHRPNAMSGEQPAKELDRRRLDAVEQAVPLGEILVWVLGHSYSCISCSIKTRAFSGSRSSIVSWISSRISRASSEPATSFAS